jgi:hypothetical protein
MKRIIYKKYRKGHKRGGQHYKVLRGRRIKDFAHLTPLEEEEVIRQMAMNTHECSGRSREESEQLSRGLFKALKELKLKHPKEIDII